jgi:hypothetical protein
MALNPLKQHPQQARFSMEDDERCCGTGTCIVDAQGLCWCGQQWDGVAMCRPAMANAVAADTPEPAQSTQETHPQ